MGHVRFRAKCWVLFWLCVACCTTVPYYTRVTWRERVKLSRNLVTGCTVYDRVLYAVHGHGCCLCVSAALYSMPGSSSL